MPGPSEVGSQPTKWQDATHQPASEPFHRSHCKAHLVAQSLHAWANFRQPTEAERAERKRGQYFSFLPQPGGEIAEYARETGETMRKVTSRLLQHIDESEEGYDAVRAPPYPTA